MFILNKTLLSILPRRKGPVIKPYKSNQMMYQKGAELQSTQKSTKEALYWCHGAYGNSEHNAHA